jgi:hypothetical protein
MGNIAHKKWAPPPMCLASESDIFLNRTTRHWHTPPGTTVLPVILSAAKNLAVETLRSAQGDTIGVPIFCGLI